MNFEQPYITVAFIGQKLLGIVGPRCSSISLFGLQHFSSVIDESFVDETRVWRKYKISILVSMMSLFIDILNKKKYLIYSIKLTLNIIKSLL